MPQLTITLTPEEYNDLQTIADERLKEPEDLAHDLLVTAISDALNRSQATASQRAYNRGVMQARREGVQSARWTEIFQRKYAQLAGPSRHRR
jgi:hypothetical protein